MDDGTSAMTHEKNQRNKEHRDELVERYLRGASRQEKRKRNRARGRSEGRGLRDDQEDGFEDEEALAPRPARSARKRDRRAREEAPRKRAGESATVLAVARTAITLLVDGEKVPTPLSGGLQGTVLAIGDEVRIERRASGPPRLLERGERRTVLTRPDPGNRHRELVIAANVDVGVVTCSAREPAFRPALVDRYLIALERGGVEALLCVSKADLLDAHEREALEEELAPYRELGVRTVCCSTRTEAGLEELREALAGRTSVLVGHSGVGKSSLVNALTTAGAAAEGAVRSFDGKGRHTTTASSLHELAGGGRLIDTPGVRAFGLAGVTADDLRASFPGFAPFLSDCRFRDCTHEEEPDCGIRAAVAAGSLPAVRYDVYLRVRASLLEAEHRS